MLGWAHPEVIACIPNIPFMTDYLECARAFQWYKAKCMSMMTMYFDREVLCWIHVPAAAASCTQPGPQVPPARWHVTSQQHFSRQLRRVRDSALSVPWQT